MAQEKNMRIPLLRMSRKPMDLESLDEPLEGLELVSSVDVFPDRELPDSCYALKWEDDSLAPVLNRGQVGVFSKTADILPAIENIFMVQVKGERPIVRKVVRDDSFRKEDDALRDAGGTPKHLRERRKSFMTPTPLHLPESRVSPIPESAHEMVYLKSMENNAPMLVMPVRKILWIHPLVFIPEPDPKTD